MGQIDMKRGIKKLSHKKTRNQSQILHSNKGTNLQEHIRALADHLMPMGPSHIVPSELSICHSSYLSIIKLTKIPKLASSHVQSLTVVLVLVSFFPCTQLVHHFSPKTHVLIIKSHKHTLV